MEELLRTIFEAFPHKSTITFNGKCSDCKDAVTIDIIPTSQGFGLLGGVFIQCVPDKYVAKCPDCHKINPEMVGKYEAVTGGFSIFDKKSILNLIF